MTGHALVVDDDQHMVRTLADILALEGWTVQTADSGISALELARNTDFDVVLMDVKMPGMDGVAAFQEMRKLGRTMPVVLMTAYAAPDRLAAAERDGVMCVLPKPVDVESLLRLLESRVRVRRPLLVIDGDEHFLKTLAGILQVQGYETIVADDLQHASALMRERRPAAILLHMHVGAISAREAVTVVHEMNPDAALILYSGQPQAAEEIGEEVPPEWISAYLQKPFAVDEVKGVLNAIRDRV